MTEDEKREDEKEKKQDESNGQEEKPKFLDEPIKISDYVYLSILNLDAKAWAYMDLIPHPETQKHQKDLAQAKLAIDSIDALLKIVENNLTQEQKKDLQNRLTNLRLNFAKKDD